MRKALFAAALTSLVSTGLITITTTTSAEAAVQTVNRAEFRALRLGMTRARVHQIFGANGVAYGGRQTSYFSGDAGLCAEGETWACPDQDREYRTSTRTYGSYGTVYLSFYRTPAGVWRLDSKSVYW